MYSYSNGSSTFRAIMVVHRLDEGDIDSMQGLKVSISPRMAWAKKAMWDWDLPEMTAQQLRRVQRMKPRQTLVFDCILRLSSWADWTDCGYEYDAALDVVRSHCINTRRK